jgi:ABC-type antimicrobial peptide transport system permease subunit
MREAERIELRVAEGADLAAVRTAVALELRSLYGAPVSAPAPFEFDDNSGAADLLSRQRDTFARLLLIVIATAGVGGFVTFASVMAAMVNERRREISLRTAYGARADDIVWQFLVEATLVAIFGAALASALSWGLGKALGYLGDAPVSMNGAVLALASSLAVLIALAAALPIAVGAVERRPAADRS